MKKEKTEISVFCDCCSKELFDSGIRTNCGKFEEPFLKRDDDIDLCWECTGKLLSIKFNRSLETEEMYKLISENRKRISGFGDNYVECDFMGVIAGVDK